MDLDEAGSKLRVLLGKVVNQRRETSDVWTAEEIKHLDDTHNGREAGAYRWIWGVIVRGVTVVW